MNRLFDYFINCSSSSVQCDPEPKPLLPVTVTVPQIIVPKRTVSPVKSNSSSSSVSLTSSSSLSKEAMSTTSDDQSTLSEGCWIKSRSEGQVVIKANPIGYLRII
jgi:hypothetical protein